MLKMNYIDYDGYGKCLEMTADGQRMLVTCDIGPRIIYFSLENEPNLFYEDREDNINQSGEYFDEHFGKGAKWHIYGGHRLWRSPEDWGSYYPDNGAVTVELLPNGARFIAKPEMETTKLQKIMTVTYDGTEFNVEHKFVNYGDKVNSCSLWALTVMNKGGTAFYPYTDKDTGLLANRNIVFWSYTNIKDARLSVADNGVVLRQDVKAETPIKIGFLNQTGEHYYVCGNQMLSVRVEPASDCGRYPDYSSSTESYTNQHMLELETLSEIVDIAPGGSAIHNEYWSIYKGDSAKYAEIKSEIEKASK